MTFLTAVDIANRAAQHCGMPRIADFTENSKQAGEFSFNYDKLRRAELRRNVWAFATRRAALRPVDTTTMLANPTLWSSTTTYGWGALVTDSSNTIWQSRAQDNLNNAPGNSSQWEQYCGPMTVTPYDTTGATAYFAGELVYETPGDGSYAVYLSLNSNNTQDPRAPSLWVNSATALQPGANYYPLQPAAPPPTPGMYVKDQVVMYYAAWAVGTTYAAGAAVSYSGNVYVSTAAGNVGNTPGVSTLWALLSASLAPTYYNALTTYLAGTFVTYKGANYVALQATTGNIPSSSPTYWVAQAAPTYYVSLIDFNLNNDPSLAPALFSLTTTYAAGVSVCGSDGTIYTSVASSNVGHDPTTTSGFWTNTGVLCPWTSIDNFGTANDAWLQLSLALTELMVQYPLGSGPSSQAVTRNVYMLPANFLRRAPQDPKAGSTSYLGAPTGLMYDDWEMEGKFIVTRETFPILLRFVADLTDVTSFDDMFCEGLAARIALETVETLTQSTSKKQGIAGEYLRVMTEARTVNGIETGPVEAPEDDFITCRI